MTLVAQQWDGPMVQRKIDNGPKRSPATALLRRNVWRPTHAMIQKTGGRC